MHNRYRWTDPEPLGDRGSFARSIRNDDGIALASVICSTATGGSSAGVPKCACPPGGSPPWGGTSPPTPQRRRARTCWPRSTTWSIRCGRGVVAWPETAKTAPLGRSLGGR